jgi:copper chaperone CopZ
LENVEEVQVNLAQGVVEVKGHNLSETNIQNAVQGLGFTCSMKEKEVLTFSVQGMHCSHCASSVQNAIASLENVEEVQVNLAQGSVEVKGHNLSETNIQNAVQGLGFTCSIKGEEK